MSDERLGRPSASAIQRYKLCPGAFAMEQSAPEEKQSDDAAAGDRIHAVMAGGNVKLDADEEVVVERIREIEEQVIANTIGTTFDFIEREERMSYRIDERVLFTGKPDLIVVFGRQGLVVDYKTGRIPVEPAEANAQLRALAVLLVHNYALEKVFTSIIQPRCTPPFSIAEYQLDELRMAEEEICGVIGQTDRATEVSPGEDQCRYCRAKIICTAYQDWANKPIVAVTGTVEVTKQSASEIAKALPGEKIAEIVKAGRGPVKWLLDAAEAEARRRLKEDPGCVPGLSLKDDPGKDEIVKHNEVFKRAYELGVKTDSFLACCKIVKERLQAALKESTKLKGKALESALAGVLDGCCERTAGEPRLIVSK